MTNDKVIKNRWKFTDEQLKITHKNFKNIFNNIKDELLELFKEFKIDRVDLNKQVPSSIIRKLNREKEEWKNQGIITPYFDFLLKTTTKLTYSNVIGLFIYALYLKYQDKEYDECKNLLVKVANDVYKQALNEIPKKPKKPKEKLTWKDIVGWTMILTINVTLLEYLNILNQTFYEDAKKLYINIINQEISPEENMLNDLIDKQVKKILNINEKEKFSGVLENLSRTVGNKAYVEPFFNQKVVFIAEMDDRTTKMCRSLNGQIFNTKDWNDFKRYSDLRKGTKIYHIFGLKEGINLPPITDHFHWCRSTIKFI